MLICQYADSMASRGEYDERDICLDASHLDFMESSKTNGTSWFWCEHFFPHFYRRLALISIAGCSPPTECILQQCSRCLNRHSIPELALVESSCLGWAILHASRVTASGNLSLLYFLQSVRVPSFDRTQLLALFANILWNQVGNEMKCDETLWFFRGSGSNSNSPIRSAWMCMFSLM